MPGTSNKKQQLATVIMAAGKGTRMKSTDKAKVMFELRGKPMLDYVVTLAQALGSDRILAIVGFQREGVMAYVRKSHPTVEFAVQEPQLGTGHAVMQAEQALRGFTGDVLVLSGDVPLLKKETLDGLWNKHLSSGAIATVLTAEPADPTGYGRIIRTDTGMVAKIVEHKDASADELAVREINSGIYVFQQVGLFDGLKHITAHNAQKEYYLTDVFGYYRSKGRKVAAVKARSVDEIQGINTLEQLQEAEYILAMREQALAH